MALSLLRFNFFMLGNRSPSSFRSAAIDMDLLLSDLSHRAADVADPNWRCR